MKELIVSVLVLLLPYHANEVDSRTFPEQETSITKFCVFKVMKNLSVSPQYCLRNQNSTCMCVFMCVFYVCNVFMYLHKYGAQKTALILSDTISVLSHCSFSSGRRRIH